MPKGRILFSLFLLAVGAGATYYAREWTFKAALFPLTVSIPLCLLATLQLLMDLSGKAEKARGPAVDMEFAADVTPEVARRRALGIFLWIIGFLLLVFLAGFPAAVPLFMISYLKMQSRLGWLQSVALTAVAWGFFYFLFQRLLHMQFEAGVIQTWMGG
jgi:putative tricarboxylic transport membrane protein